MFSKITSHVCLSISAIFDIVVGLNFNVGNDISILSYISRLFLIRTFSVKQTTNWRVLSYGTKTLDILTKLKLDYMYLLQEQCDPVQVVPCTISKKNSKLSNIFGLGHAEEVAFAWINLELLIDNTWERFIKGVVPFFLNHK